MLTLLTTVFLASLVGSLHCVGMCGGFVAFYSGADGSGGSRRLLSHAAYSGGRLAAYATLGMAAGLVGAALDVAGSLAGFQRSAAVVAGAIMVTWGVLALLRIGGVKIFRHGSGSTISRWLGRGISLVGQRPPLVRAAVVGLLSGALPCGWLWAFVVTGAGTGSALGGAAVMTAFWAGTVPVLFALGLGAQVVAVPLRRHIPAVTALILVGLGLYAIVGRPTTAIATMAKHRSATVAVPSADDAPPCCGE
ncbi:MAG: sulfite exporter TauE/SafE family protein [Thermoanaerobaculales bacterium]|jgi:sulfite exporter TauE/SafE|nr:sulfite exporter TauE/SafE family protein [Thermoanaerobaculales bacterium]